MKKIKTIPTIGKYLRELSIVVLGVAITLSVSYWITNKNEKRDMALYLNAIKLELEENIKYLDAEADYFEDWRSYGIYLQSHDKKSLHPDSIRTRAYPGLGRLKNFIFKASAFEMFKVSGAMRLIDDKELLQSLWDVYLTRTEKVRLSFYFYYELKTEQCIKENQLILEGKPNPIPLYDFFTMYSNIGVLEECLEFSEALKETVLKLEKSLNIK